MSKFYEARYQFTAKSNPRLRSGTLIVESPDENAARAAAVAKLGDFGYSYFRVVGVTERPADGGTGTLLT